MCRFFGQAGLNSSESISETEFMRLTRLSHRGGPDSTAYFRDKHCFIGFNRLAILDPTPAGNQPVISPSGRYVLVLNGEIYNYRQLSERYNLRLLRSGSDAEVISHLLDSVPFQKILEELNGMFALTVWDTKDLTIQLARDSVGIKPHFYSITTRGLIFSSQFDQILKHPWVSSADWNPQGLRAYLQFGAMTAPDTIKKGVFQLEPGELIKFSLLDKKTEKKRFKVHFTGDVEPALSETSKNAFSSLKIALQNAVERQLVSDVPLGIFLSGGVDSALVASVAKEFRPDITALTVGFNKKELDESPIASAYAKALGIRHETVMVDEEDVKSILQNHFSYMGEPIADYGSLPYYLISQTASRVNKVMLTGDGGDELLWGYPRFRTFAHSLPYFSIPGSSIRKITKKILKKAGKDITGYLGAPNLGAANMQFHSYMNSNILTEMFYGVELTENLDEIFRFSDTELESALNYLRQNEFYVHLQRVLAKVDRMSMANSLEVRVPLLDLEVIDVVERIRPELTANHNELKYLLKKTLEAYLPRKLFDIPKMGFMPPIEQWASTVLYDDIRETLHDKSSIRRLPWNPQTVENIVRNYYKNNGSIGIHNIWPIYVLLKWNNQYLN
jgi:asparagine synthase (glutamine-hydrolysing)